MMKFRTARLEVGPMNFEDKEAILDLVTDKIVGKTYMFPEFSSREAAEPLFRRLVEMSRDDSRYVAGIYLDGQFIGMMNDVEIKGKQVEMGYAFLPAYYNHGYATEAFTGAIEYLLKNGFETVLAGAFSGNTASLRVMEKCGMKKQEYTDEIEYRGVNYTCIYYAITKEEKQ